MSGGKERTGLYVRRRRPRVEDTVQIDRREHVTVRKPDGEKLTIIKSSETLRAPYAPVGWGCSRKGCEWFVVDDRTDMAGALGLYSQHVHFRQGLNGKGRLIKDKRGDPEGRCVRAWSTL